MKIRAIEALAYVVIPVKTGIQLLGCPGELLDSRLRGNVERLIFRTFASGSMDSSFT